jgi:HupE / UreJ protein
LRRWLAALLLFCLATAANAHLTPGSALELVAGSKSVDVTVTVAEAEWAYAYPEAPPSVGVMAVHLTLMAPGGESWTVVGNRLERRVQGGVTDLIFHARLRPPAGASARRFVLNWSGVIDRVSSHRVLVSAQADFQGGVLEGEPRLIGALQAATPSLDIDLGDASSWRGFVATLRLGMRHIAEGADHLMFLLALLLAAPGIAVVGRWQAIRATRDAVVQVLKIITAFTVGHSLTLIGGAAFGWQLPVKPVEIGIALSVLVSAIHAARPLFAGREPWIAGAFGLVHGMAFATVIANFSLPPVERGLAILGFNLGIETVQIALAALLLPVLLWLANGRYWSYIRTRGAVLAGGAALVWLAQRV